jgi:hypothetical protein
MTEFTLTDSDAQRNIDLGLSRVISVTNLSLNSVKIHIDYDRNGSGQFSSAIKGSAGYSNPFTLQPEETKVVAKTDLESEHVRVAVDGDGFKVKFIY